MRKLWRAQFGLRTLMLAMLVLGVTPWLVVRYLKWRENQVWTAFYTAVHDRDEALQTWRRVYAKSVQFPTDATKSEESALRNRYYAARQRIDDAMERMRSFYDESSEDMQQAIEIRAERRAIPERATKSLAENAK